jgi:hypothetical protein
MSMVSGTDARIDVGEPNGAEAENQKAPGEQPAVVDPLRDEAHDGQADHGADAARGDNEAGRQRRVAQHFLVEQRHHGDGDVDGKAQHEDQQAAHREVAIAREDFQIHQRLLGLPRMPDEPRQRDDARISTAQRIHTAPEPVDLLAFVEDRSGGSRSRGRAGRSRGCRKAPALAFLMYGGSWTKRLIMKDRQQCRWGY